MDFDKWIEELSEPQTSAELVNTMKYCVIEILKTMKG